MSQSKMRSIPLRLDDSHSSASSCRPHVPRKPSSLCSSPFRHSTFYQSPYVIPQHHPHPGFHVPGFHVQAPIIIHMMPPQMPRMQYLPPLQKSVPRKAPRQATGSTSSTEADSDDEIPLLDFMQKVQIKKAQQLHRLKERKRGTKKRTLCTDRKIVRVEEYEDKELEEQIDKSHFAHLYPEKNTEIDVISDTEEEVEEEEELEKQSEPAPEPLRVVEPKRRSKELMSPKENLYNPLPPVMETVKVEDQPPSVSSSEGTLTNDINPSSILPNCVERISSAKDILKAMESASLKDRSLTKTLEDCKSLKKKTSFWKSVKNILKRKDSRGSGLVYADKALYI